MERMHNMKEDVLRFEKRMPPIDCGRPIFNGTNASGGIRFLLFKGIRGHPFAKTWELRDIRFHKMGIRFSKTPFWEGIKRNQLPLLKF